MARSQPYTVAVNGGLVKSSNVIDLLKTPGVAKDLRNFEVSTEGGYRRINGYQKFGTGSSTQPTGGTTNILGVFPYADGVIVSASTNIYFTQDGITYLQIIIVHLLDVVLQLEHHKVSVNLHYLKLQRLIMEQ